MTIARFVERLVNRVDCSIESCVLAVSLLNRLQHEEPELDITLLSIHRFLLAAILCSAKFFDDTIAKQREWAVAGGGSFPLPISLSLPPSLQVCALFFLVSVTELCCLEREFLARIKYSLWIPEEMYIRVSLSVSRNPHLSVSLLQLWQRCASDIPATCNSLDSIACEIDVRSALSPRIAPLLPRDK